MTQETLAPKQEEKTICSECKEEIKELVFEVPYKHIKLCKKCYYAKYYNF
jgi:formylmethanofuran dehydrogenase subunit E